MGPRRLLLAPLALLLLALCGLSSSDNTACANGDCVTFDEKIGKFVGASGKAADVKKKGAQGFLALVGAFGHLAEGTDPNQIPMKDALNNGVLCALKDATQADNWKTLLYGVTGSTPLTGADKTMDDAFAEKIGIKCPGGASPAETCFCTEKKVALWCAGIKWQGTPAYQGHTEATCPDKALADLERDLPHLATMYSFAKRFDWEVKMATALKKTEETGDADELKTALAADFAGFICNTVDGKARTLVEALQKSDVAYSMVELVIALAALEGPENYKKVVEACVAQNAEMLADPVGKCLCDNKYGFSFCIYEGIGLALTKGDADGYLDCTKNAETIKEPAKKPTSVKVAPPAVKKGGNSGGGGTGNVTTASPPSAGDVANLLPVVLTAAAAALRN